MSTVVAGFAERLTWVSNCTLAATVRHGNNAGDCGTQPSNLRRRASAGEPPSTTTSPAVGFSSPAMMRSNVVLPLPDATNSVKNSPGRTVSEISQSASN
ncbi:unannotated protein [freshwater metagenome]|uniref:Unannotated protein n=1 Tax=freshwater metagenome TaxID=449393 RepID=A0A6J6YP29_9ZZZZ